MAAEAETVAAETRKRDEEAEMRLKETRKKEKKWKEEKRELAGKEKRWKTELEMKEKQMDELKQNNKALSWKATSLEEELNHQRNAAFEAAEETKEQIYLKEEKTKDQI